MEELCPHSLRSLSLTAGAVAFFLFSFLWALRFRFRRFRKKKMECDCSCSCGSDGGGAAGNSRGETSSAWASRDVAGKDKAAAERHSGASMMEQLVPEITTHALSYLDHTSLCNLSMTNSAMRRAANDDNAWKALYHKDFTVEQDDLAPTHGWKSYYAATKAIVNVNAEFCSRERSLPAMARFWLHADYVKCIHSSGELYIGFNAVMNSWAAVFNWAPGVAFQIRDVRARVSSDIAWVTMKAYIDLDSDQFFMTNVFEFHEGRWLMVHHHSSIMVMDGDPGPGQANGFA
ncbi:F-box protein SKIP8-like [Phalaenopsis equestris]|uniref:F-box protein SKIP8-like n=1 Tax=Phalaenopsis equestris TaxID=78828 RepID=UPI0009E41C45|nr:F-box protein SKIP8-like [Phalaenopsis equestris]